MPLTQWRSGGHQAPSRRLLAGAVLLLLLLLSACGDDPSEPQPADSPLHLVIRGTATDPGGIPLGGVNAEAWLVVGQDTSFFSPALLSGTADLSGEGVTAETLPADLSGQLLVRVAGLAQEPCTRFPDTTVVLPFTRTPGTAADTVRADIRVTPEAASPWDGQPLCGSATASHTLLYLTLWPDSAGSATTTGTWKLSYTATIGTRHGVFAGVRANDTLLLTLTDTTLGSGSQYLLPLPLAAGDTIGPALLSGLPPSPPGPFWFEKAQP